MRPLHPIFLLEGTNVLDTAEVDSVIGQFYGSGNYSLDSDTSGQFAIDGDELVVADVLTAGVYTITVGSDDGDLDFDITVIET